MLQKTDGGVTSTAGTNDASTLGGRDSEAMRSAVAAVVVKTKKNGRPYGVNKTDGAIDKRMTPKMQSFASNIVQGMSPSDSYRRAYDCANMGEASIASEANRLLKDHRISQLLSTFWVTLKENVIADAISTRRHIMSQLYEHAEQKDGRVGDKLKALELMGRAVGMFTDKLESKVEEVNVDTLKKELESSLALLQDQRPKLRVV